MFDNLLKLTVVAAAALSTGTRLNAQTVSGANGPYYATPSWDQKLPSATRFMVLSNWGGQAVLDRETGLVWALSLASGASNYLDAVMRCQQDVTGDRGGWRLPTMAELLRTTVVGAMPITDSPFAFLTLFPAMNLWSSTPQTIASSDVPDSVIVVDRIYTLSLTPQRFSVSGVDRTTRQHAAAVWCVQSPSGG